MREYDIHREVLHIQQASSQNKRPIGFFLGAGCPLSVRVQDGKGETKAIIPDIDGLTASVANALSGKNDNTTDWDKLCETFSEDGLPAPNVEEALTRIRALKSVAGKGKVRGLTTTNLDELDAAVCKIIAQEVDQSLTSRDTAFHNLAIWSRSIDREKAVHAFTTNYDLLLEQAFEESRARYFDGFVGARRGFFDLRSVEDEVSLPANWTRLWKLHGSINWRLAGEGKNVEVVRGEVNEAEEKFLIFPSHLKYLESRKMPYLAMMDRLKEFLLKPSSVMFVSGYSFGDEHINDVICRALEANPTAMVYAFLFGELEPSGLEEKYSQAQECAMRTPNISIIARDCGIISREKRKWVCSGAISESIPLGVLDMQEAEGANEGSSQATFCNLGDFAVFAQLLRRVTGVGPSGDVHD